MQCDHNKRLLKISLHIVRNNNALYLNLNEMKIKQGRKE